MKVINNPSPLQFKNNSNCTTNGKWGASRSPSAINVLSVPAHQGLNPTVTASMAWRLMNGRCQPMRSIPAATQRHDQLDTGGHLLQLQVHLGPLIA
jgi:hypothetical protein